MRTRPLQIGITGGIGSGKSTVCKIFDVLGVRCYNADKRARWLMEKDSNLIDDIKHLFGPESFRNDRINRDYLANITFNNPENLVLLNALVHPKVAVDFENWVNTQRDEVYLIKEAALLFESGSYKSLDFVVNVSASVDLRTKRILKRDPFRSHSEIASIIERQLSEEDRNELAHFIIHNNESESLVKQIIKLHDRFRKE